MAPTRRSKSLDTPDGCFAKRPNYKPWTPPIWAASPPESHSAIPASISPATAPAPPINATNHDGPSNTNFTTANTCDVHSVPTCPHCNRTFTSRVGLVIHLRINRKETDNPEVGPQKGLPSRGKSLLENSKNPLVRALSYCEYANYATDAESKRDFLEKAISVVKVSHQAQKPLESTGASSKANASPILTIVGKSQTKIALLVPAWEEALDAEYPANTSEVVEICNLIPDEEYLFAVAFTQKHRQPSEKPCLGPSTVPILASPVLCEKIALGHIAQLLDIKLCHRLVIALDLNMQHKCFVNAMTVIETIVLLLGPYLGMQFEIQDITEVQQTCLTQLEVISEHFAKSTPRRKTSTRMPSTECIRLLAYAYSRSLLRLGNRPSAVEVLERAKAILQNFSLPRTWSLSSLTFD
ncbi:unnamed protein product [Schistocephalus solidus]|uniref:C2H2-type domain-containing protein n=1 Tax=Schistocephalus solidus TaxID=70667 RepID=A0A183TAU5_SCHSO|nr:unnamed protein product [Schistocephalus solidus]